MESERIVKIVNDLNNNLSEEMYDNELGYDYLTNGFIDLIKFCDWTVYNSEDNSEDDIEEAGGLREFIMQEKNKYIDMLLKVR